MIGRVEALLGELIAYPTVSSDSNLAMIEALEAHLAACGARMFRDENEDGTKANLFASFGPDAEGGVLLSGHTDVVPVTDQDWSGDPFVMGVHDGRFYGRGACDMKGFIAACLAMAEQLDASALTRPLHMAFTYDEETGCVGAGHLVEAMAARGLRPDIAVIGEPTSMQIIEGHKGCYEYRTRITGLEGHGSRPDLGVNAAEFAARYVGRLLELREDLKARCPAGSRFEPPWTTLNVGRISGGVAPNVIAGKAEIEWEMRPVEPEDADFVKERIGAFCSDVLLPAMRAVDPEAGISTETLGEIAALVPMDKNDAREFVARLTGRNEAGLVSFGTEAGLFQSLGTDVVVCGPGSIEQAHKPDEYVSRDQLQECCEMLERLAADLSG